MKLRAWNLTIRTGTGPSYAGKPQLFTLLKGTCPVCQTEQVFESKYGSEITEEKIESRRSFAWLLDQVIGDQHCQRCRVVSDTDPDVAAQILGDMHGIVTAEWFAEALASIGAVPRVRETKTAMDTIEDYMGFETPAENADREVEFGWQAVADAQPVGSES